MFVSCTGKLAGLDKKLSRSLDQEVAQIAESGTSPLELSRSPVGPLTDASRCGGVIRGVWGARVWEGQGQLEAVWMRGGGMQQVLLRQPGMLAV